MRLVFVVFVFSCSLAGCLKAEPAGFWTKFPDGLVTQNNHEHAGRGGWSTSQGSARPNEAFSVQRIKSFAADNGWKLLSEQKVSAESMKTWMSWDGKAFFPLGYDGFAPGKNDAAYDHFPRTITANATVLTFDSGWITAIGGVEKPAYGCVLLTEDGKSLAVYHLWGE